MGWWSRRLFLVASSVQDQAAAGLAAICAFLAPEPARQPGFPAPLTGQVADPVAWLQVLARVGQQALARLDQDGLQMHRLALDPDTSTAALSDLTYDAAWYLIRRGDARNGYDLARRLCQHRRDQLGPGDRETLDAAATLAATSRALGRYDRARELDEDTLVRRRLVLGEDHPSTLASASNLAIDLRPARPAHPAEMPPRCPRQPAQPATGHPPGARTGPSSSPRGV